MTAGKPIEREVFPLFYAQGFSVDEIAEGAKRSPSLVWSVLKEVEVPRRPRRKGRLTLEDHNARVAAVRLAIFGADRARASMTIAACIALTLSACGGDVVDVRLYGEHVATLDQCVRFEQQITAWAPTGETLLIEVVDPVQVELVGGAFAEGPPRRWAGPPEVALAILPVGFRIAFADQYGLELEGSIPCGRVDRQH